VINCTSRANEEGTALASVCKLFTVTCSLSVIKYKTCNGCGLACGVGTDMMITIRVMCKEVAVACIKLQSRNVPSGMRKGLLSYRNVFM
jgi:hypothetical protein